MCVLYVSFGSKVRPRTFGCAWGAIWLNPFATVLFSVCSAVTVECCVLYPCCMGVFGMLLLCEEEGSSPVFFQLLRGGMWACMRCPCLCLCSVLEYGLC